MTATAGDATKMDMQLNWKALWQATLSGGDFLLWSSEWHEASKKNVTLNAQSGNPDWDLDMLLGEGQYEGNVNQIGFPARVYAQVAMAARCGWTQLPMKGDFSGSLASIRQAPVLLRNLFILQAVRLVLTYNFSNCDFEELSETYRATIFPILREDLNGTLFDQMEDCESKPACLLKIEYYTLNPIPGCPSLPEKEFALRTRAAFIKHCPGFSETERKGTQEMAQEVKNICLNQTSQIRGLWYSFFQSP
ncbi:thymic stromal lymphopoietin [Mastomys coucha]|uniref:thymic stromal lymphopoietin n=1 Tax=Mastomys coucha TaxID=35658 RepID=UPI001261AD8B|nr:thymic stromal lymphopoietin [Mastomys coucha]